MESQLRYAVRQNLLAAIAREESKGDLVHIPAGSYVIVTPGSKFRDDQFVEILWQEQRCLVFSIDFECRACRVCEAISG